MRWRKFKYFSIFILLLLYTHISLSQAQFSSEVEMYTRKIEQYTLLLALSDAAAAHSTVATTLKEKESLEQLSQVLWTEAASIYKDFEKPLLQLQSEIEKYITLHFVVRLSEWEKANGHPDNARLILSIFAQTMGVSIDALLSRHIELNSVFGHFPIFGDLDQEIDLLLETLSFSQNNDSDSFKKLLARIQHPYFKKSLMTLYQQIQMEMSQRSSSNLNLNQYLRGAVSLDKGEDYHYFKSTNEANPSLKKIVYAALFQNFKQKYPYAQVILGVLPEDPSKITEADLTLLIELYAEEEARREASQAITLSPYKKVDFWQSAYGVPSSILINPGMLGLTAETLALGALAASDGAAMLLLPPTVTAGVVVFSFLYAAAPNVDHHFFNRPLPNSTLCQRFIFNTMVGLPTALLFQGAATLFPKTTLVTAIGLTTWQASDSFRDQRYFESLISATLVAGLGMQTINVFSEKPNLPPILDIQYPNSLGTDAPSNLQFQISVPKNPTSVLAESTTSIANFETPLTYRIIHEPQFNRVRIVSEKLIPKPLDEGFNPGSNHDVLPKSKPGGYADAASEYYSETIQHDPYILNGGEPTSFEPPSSNIKIFDLLGGPENNSGLTVWSRGLIETFPNLKETPTQTVPEVLPRTTLKTTRQDNRIGWRSQDISFGLTVKPSVFTSFEPPRNFFRFVPMTGNPAEVSTPGKKWIIIIRRDNNRNMIGMIVKHVNDDENVEKISIFDDIYTIGSPTLNADGNLPQSSASPQSTTETNGAAAANNAGADDEDADSAARTWKNNPFLLDGQHPVTISDLKTPPTVTFADDASGKRILFYPGAVQVEDSLPQSFPFSLKHVIKLGHYAILIPEGSGEIYFVNLRLLASLHQEEKTPTIPFMILPLPQNTLIRTLELSSDNASAQITYEGNVSSQAPNALSEGLLDILSLFQLQLFSRSFEQQDGQADWLMKKEIAASAANVEYITGIKGLGSLLIDHATNLVPTAHEMNEVELEEAMKKGASSTTPSETQSALPSQITGVELSPEMKLLSQIIQIALPPIESEEDLFQFFIKNIVRLDDNSLETIERDKPLYQEIVRLKQHFENEAQGRFSSFKSDLDPYLLLSQEEADTTAAVHPKGLTIKAFFSEEPADVSVLDLKNFYSKENTMGLMAPEGKTIQRLELWSGQTKVRTLFISTRGIISTQHYVVILPVKGAQGRDALPKVMDLRLYPKGPIPLFYAPFRADLGNCNIVSAQANQELISLTIQKEGSPETLIMSSASLRELINAQATIFNILALLTDPSIQESPIMQEIIDRVSVLLQDSSGNSQTPEALTNELKNSMQSLADAYLLRPESSQSLAFSKEQEKISQAMTKVTQVSTQYQGLIRSLMLSLQAANGYRPLGGRGMVAALAVAAAIYAYNPDGSNAAAAETLNLFKTTGSWLADAFSTFTHLSSNSAHSMTAMATDTPTAVENLATYRTPVMMSFYIGCYVAGLVTYHTLFQAIRLVQDLRSNGFQEFRAKWSQQQEKIGGKQGVLAAARAYLIEREKYTMVQDGVLKREVVDGQVVFVRYKLDKSGKPISRKLINIGLCKALVSMFTSWTSRKTSVIKGVQYWNNMIFWPRALLSNLGRSMVQTAFPNFKLVARKGIIPTQMNGGMWFKPAFPGPDPMLVQTENHKKVMEAELLAAQKITEIARDETIKFATQESVQDAATLAKAMAEKKIPDTVMKEVLSRRAQTFALLIYSELFKTFERNLTALNPDTRDVWTRCFGPEQSITIPDEETLNQWIAQARVKAVEEATAYAEMSAPLKWLSPTGRKLIGVRMKEYFVRRYSKVTTQEQRVIDAREALATDPKAAERATSKFMTDLIVERPIDLALLLILTSGATGEASAVGPDWWSENSVLFLNRYYFFGIGTDIFTMPAMPWIKVIEDRNILKMSIGEDEEYNERPPADISYLRWYVRQTAFNSNNRLPDVYRRSFKILNSNIVPNLILKLPLNLVFLHRFDLDFFFWGYILAYSISPIHSWMDQGIEKASGYERRDFTDAQMADPEIRKIVRERHIRRRAKMQLALNILWNIEGFFTQNFGILPGANGAPREGIQKIYGGLTGGRDVLPTQDAANLCDYLSTHYPATSGFWDSVKFFITNKHPLYRDPK